MSEREGFLRCSISYFNLASWHISRWSTRFVISIWQIHSI